ncbi:hypothetical protein BJX66DRAFT_110805 [Aspergillus keveii]|uniref:Uncharacterized protein n=1 Tax=Aspergillus keveii TaxID=714993 RepID=A0ABR4FKW5_9EURO
MSSSDTDAQTVALYNAFQMDLAKAVLGLDSVLAAASMGLAIGAVILRRREGYREKSSFAQLPQRTISGFLGANFIFGVFVAARYGIAVNVVASLSGSTETFYYVGDILPYFFLYAGNCALIYILYHFLHLLLEGCAKTQTPSSRLIKIHWSLVGLVIVMSIVEWGLMTKDKLLPLDWGTPNSQERQAPYVNAYAGFDTATYFVRLGLSSEILWRSIRVCMRTLGKRSRWRALSILLLITATFLFALNLMWTIWDIIWLILPATRSEGPDQEYSNAFYAASICQAVFYLLIYVGIVSFCLRWGWLAARDQRKAAERVEKEEIERAALPPEADSKVRAMAEVDGKGMDYEKDSSPINEADSVPLVEADGARVRGFGPAVELDSTEVRRELP